MTRVINGIIIHCAATPNGKPFTVEDIDRWHDERGFARRAFWRTQVRPELKAVGYHYVVLVDGTVASGRHEDEVGAHAGGFNDKTVGVCLVGTDKFSGAQWASLAKLVAELQGRYPRAKVLGHRDLSPDTNGNGLIEPDEWVKTCPGFDVALWLSSAGVAPAGALLEG